MSTLRLQTELINARLVAELAIVERDSATTERDALRIENEQLTAELAVDTAPPPTPAI